MSTRIHADRIYRNLAPSKLYELALKENPHTQRCVIAANGALISYSGSKTGRSPYDKRIVREDSTEKDIWWGRRI